MAVAAEVGRIGERIARQYVEQEMGMVVLGRNWRCKHGELDMIATDREQLVVFEVKCRSGTHHGSPLEALTPQQLNRIRTATLCWLRAAQSPWVPLRFDLIGVWLPPVGKPRLRHVPGV